MTGAADTPAPLEAILKDEILRMYQAVAEKVQGHAATTGMRMECREGSMEDIPLPAPCTSGGGRGAGQITSRERCG